MACGPARAARGREGADPAERRARGRRQELPWVRIEKEYTFETDEGAVSLADLFGGRSQLAHVPLHVRPGVHRGLSGVLGDRGRLQRFGRPPREPRRGDVGGIPRTAREAPGLQAPDELELSVGILLRQRLQLRLQCLGYRGAAARGDRRIQLPPVDTKPILERPVPGSASSRPCREPILRRIRGRRPA